MELVYSRAIHKGGSNAIKRGLDAVCEVMERYERKAIERSNVDSIKYMITTFGATEDQVLGNKNYSKTEYNTALKELSEERKGL